MLRNYLFKNRGVLLILLATFVAGTLYSTHIIFVGIAILFFTGNFSFNSKKNIDTDFALLVFIMLSYCLFASANNNVSFAMFSLRAIPSIALFSLGCNLVKRNENYEYWYAVLLVTAFLTGIANIYFGIDDTIKNGFIVPERMFGVDKDEFEHTTSLIASQLIPTIACVGLLYDTPSIANKKLRWSAIFIGLIGTLCAMHYVSRAGILIMVLSVFISLLFRSRFNSRTIFFIIATIVAYIIFMQSDAYAAFELKNEIGGDISTGNGRDERMLYWLNRVMYNPMGIVNWANEYTLYPWAHNFWLDFTKECGIIPGLALVIFSIRNLYFVVRIALTSRVNKSVAHLILLLGIAYFLTLFTEPTMQGAPLLMFSYFMFCGAVKSIYKIEKH